MVDNASSRNTNAAAGISPLEGPVTTFVNTYLAFRQESVAETKLSELLTTEDVQFIFSHPHVRIGESPNHACTSLHI